MKLTQTRITGTEETGTPGTMMMTRTMMTRTMARRTRPKRGRFNAIHAVVGITPTAPSPRSAESAKGRPVRLAAREIGAVILVSLDVATGASIAIARLQEMFAVRETVKIATTGVHGMIPTAGARTPILTALRDVLIVVPATAIGSVENWPMLRMLRPWPSSSRMWMPWPSL